MISMPSSAACCGCHAAVANVEHQTFTLLQIQNETTLKSKLRADRRNMDLQRRHDSLKDDQQHTQRALAASQVLYQH